MPVVAAVELVATVPHAMAAAVSEVLAMRVDVAVLSSLMSKQRVST
jgi:hypothetical protein